MSLFKVRDWWCTQCGDDGDFDQGLLCVANIDNNTDGADKLIVGSQQKGILQIYGPKIVLNASTTAKEGDNTDETLQGFRPDELLVEFRMNSPILQLSTGRFVSGTNEIQLAVLHPRKLAIYSVTGNKGAVEHGTQYQLTLIYEHKLQRSSYALVVGPFGEIKGKDLLCVLSLDGVLSFFEQDSFAFSRFLPGFLLPGPLIYAPKVDSIITVSSSYQLESYRYPTLAVAKEPDEGDSKIAGGIQHGKRVTADWTLSLAESAIDMVILETPNLPSIIFVLGRKNIFAVKDNGILLWMKKLDYEPSCFLPYHGMDMCPMLLVCTANRTLLVYNDQTLKWAAHLPYAPVSVQRCTISTLKGVLVMLGPQGCLSCSYLGTDPSLLVAPVPITPQEINFVEAEKELRQLRTHIGGTEKFKAKTMFNHNCFLHISVQSPVGTTLDIPVSFISVRVEARREAIQNVRVSITVNSPFTIDRPVHHYPLIRPDDLPIQADAFVRIPEGSEGLWVSNLQLKAMAVYYTIDAEHEGTNGGVPHIMQSNAELPLNLALQIANPVKAATYKITLDTNKNCADLRKLFPEFIWAGTIEDNAIAFQYAGYNDAADNPTVVTILGAKNTQRYRVQSSSFAALWLPVSELVNRLRMHFQRDSKFKCSLPSHGSGSQLPLAEFLSEIDDHYQTRMQKRHLCEVLQQSAAQFRIIQKRLLVKTKDKSACPLNNLDILLDASYHQLLTLSEAATKASKALQLRSCSLSCAIRLIKLLSELQQTDKISKGQTELLDAIISHTSLQNGIQAADQGWEEQTDAALGHILSPNESNLTSKMQGANLPFLQPGDMGRLRKQIAIVLTKISKGNFDKVLNKEPENEEKNEEIIV